MQKTELINKDILIGRIQQLLIKQYGDNIKQDFDLYDFEANTDDTLTIEENFTMIDDDFKIIYQKKMDERRNKEMEIEANNLERQESHRGEGLYRQQANYLILGKKGSGKSSLAWYVMEMIYLIQKKKCYVYKFPKPELLEKLPFKVRNIAQLNDLYRITDGVVLIDEAHQYFDVLNKKTNEKLKNILAISRQNNTDFIFCCHNSYFITRNLFSFIDVKMIKEVNEGHWELERTHMKKLYEYREVKGIDRVYIDCDYDSSEKTVGKPEWFTEDISLAYRYKEEKKDYFKQLLEKYGVRQVQP